MSPVGGERNFERVLLEAIDEALAMLGESVKKIVYFHVENKYLLKAEDIPKQPELFILAIKSLLGTGGTYIESLVLKKLCEEYRLDYESFANTPLEEAIQQIRKSIREI